MRITKKKRKKEEDKLEIMYRKILRGIYMGTLGYKMISEGEQIKEIEDQETKHGTSCEKAKSQMSNDKWVKTNFNERDRKR